MTHLSITIGPIYKTIKEARSTRDIWAASFIFSLMMKEILKQLKVHPSTKDKVKTILTPDSSGVKSTETHHGAGVYPDRCHVLLTAALTDEEMSDFRKAVYNKLPNGLGVHSDYFHIYAVQANFSDTVIASLKQEDNIIFQMSKVLEDAELQQQFIPTNAPNIIERLDGSIEKLYAEGMAVGDMVFIPGWDGQKPRLPSLIEISTRGLKKKPYYKNTVTDKIWRNIRRGRKHWDDADEKVLEDLKNAVNAEKIEELKARHKYYAIVQSDGDSVGKIISGLGNNADKIASFSKALMTFSKKAADKIAEFGAIPVYIGGDDLLFIAPLMNEEGVNLFKLIQDLDKEFTLKEEGATLSFGIAINYYKHPMSEALTNAYHQLFYAAKKLEIGEKTSSSYRAKNALAFQTRKHSGQHFGTILSKEGMAFPFFLEMLNTHQAVEAPFLSATMYTLLDQQFLLMNALATERTKYFFEHHFKKTSHQKNKPFLVDVEQLAIKLYTDLKGVQANSAWTSYFPKNKEEREGEASTEKEINSQNIIANTLFSCLRLIQFLNAKDHD